MCGICGELRFDGLTADLPALERMMHSLVRRGPDHGGSFSEGPLALGHRRLAVIDLSEDANQPMHDPALKLVIVFNGTIYNYRALRAELVAMGYRFFSQGDTEVILKAYHAWGEACLERLDGMFAFAIRDLHRHTLFLARDRFGIKPLYLSRDDRRLRFASSLPALLASGDVGRALDPVGLALQFRLHGAVPAPHTVLRAVEKLPPASCLHVDAHGHYRQRTYWHLEARRPDSEMDATRYVAWVRDKLVAAVERQSLAADVPVGVLLSGGLDSSLLLALLAELGQRDIPTFSIGFHDQPEESGNEFIYSDLVARHFGSRHHRYQLPDAEVLTALPEAIAAMSEPMFSQDNVAFYLLAREVHKEVKVVLSGQGADEVFGGYFWYPQMAAEPDDLAPAVRFARHYLDRTHAEYLEMVEPAWSTCDHAGALLATHLSAPGADTFLDQVLRFDVTTLIVDDPVKRVDNMTMAWGLEARVPFLDRELVETAMRLPPELRLQDGGKYPLKAIARGLLPDAVIDRPKGYFPTPALKYLRGGFLAFIQSVLNSPACRARGLFRRAYVERLLADPMGHFTPLQGNKLWHLAVFEYWLQTHVDGGQPS
jgi:asparagine synthase (glutamine-hydrolysing)